jgi:hypothetical protein
LRQHRLQAQHNLQLPHKLLQALSRSLNHRNVVSKPLTR